MHDVSGCSHNAIFISDERESAIPWKERIEAGNTNYVVAYIYIYTHRCYKV